MEPRYSAPDVEPKIRDLWEEKGIYKFDPSDKRKVFSIDTPPPTVSGALHLGHIFSYSQAEFIARFKRMRGYSVFYPFGLDNNGLPTELLIEKKLGIIAENVGRERFVSLVEKEIGEYNRNYIELFRKVGLSVDWSLLYETISKRVQRMSQLSFLELVKQYRVYRKEAPALFCPKCKTTVSQMELRDKVLKSKLYRIKFTDQITIATTRPELLPACVAVFVNPSDERYASVVDTMLKVPLFGDEVKVYNDPRVDPSYGTGAVMCCTFGDQTDIEWFKAYNLPLKMLINSSGRLHHPKHGELKIKEARERIVRDLDEQGLVVSEQEIEHPVNAHERCDTEIEFVIKKQWYIRYMDLKEKFLELGSQINWHPEHMLRRYENWVNGLQWDWNISRQRFFGVSFPLWYCARCGEPVFAKEEEVPIDPFIQKPSVGKCVCGSSEFMPETDVMDTWATSSLTPLINARWKERGCEDFQSRVYPMSLRVQAHDIISFWAFTTIVKSFLHSECIPWEDIMISGHGLDPKGQPMSKSKGNVILPEPYMEKYGADALRYWASSSTLGEDNSFQEKEVVSGSRFINKLWNVARFVEMSSSEFSNQVGKPSTNVFDKWIINKMNETIEKATKNFENYDYYKARVAAEEFFWKFADDYIEFVKDRIYGGDNLARSIANRVLFCILRLLAPFVPYVTEEIYLSVFARKNKLTKLEESESSSVHLCRWPEANSVVKQELEGGEIVVRAVREIRKLKHENGIALNESIKVATLNAAYESEIDKSLDDIKRAMKVATIEFAHHNSDSLLAISVEKA